MSEPTRRPISVVEYDRDASRVLAALDGADRAEGSFPARLEASLAALLALFESDPALAARLTARPPSPRLTARVERWRALFAARLRAAAERSSHHPLPPAFLEPHLIAGIGSLIERELRQDSPDLLGLLPGMLEFVLVYYLDPSEVGALIAARRAATGCSLEPPLR